MSDNIVLRIQKTNPAVNPEGNPWDALEELQRLLQAVDGFKAGSSTREGLWHYADIARRAAKHLRANVSEATRSDSVVVEGVTAGETALRLLAREFVDYWTGENEARIARVGRKAASGCGMCGGVPHSTTCYVGRMVKLVGSHGKEPVSEASGSTQSEAQK